MTDPLQAHQEHLKLVEEVCDDARPTCEVLVLGIECEALATWAWFFEINCDCSATVQFCCSPHHRMIDKSMRLDPNYAWRCATCRTEGLQKGYRKL